jgi:hypothetical protein
MYEISSFCVRNSLIFCSLIHLIANQGPPGKFIAPQGFRPVAPHPSSQGSPPSPRGKAVSLLLFQQVDLPGRGSGNEGIKIPGIIFRWSPVFFDWSGFILLSR